MNESWAEEDGSIFGVCYKQQYHDVAAEASANKNLLK